MPLHQPPAVSFHAHDLQKMLSDELDAAVAACEAAEARAAALQRRLATSDEPLHVAGRRQAAELLQAQARASTATADCAGLATIAVEALQRADKYRQDVCLPPHVVTGTAHAQSS